MSESATTARAFFQPRAPTSTCCWHSVSEVGDSTRWDPVTYDPIVPFITSFSGFGFWVDWCGSAWCNTATVGTTCIDGSVRGISMSSACGGTARCLTETMYEKYGDRTPKLHKVFCERGSWTARTYYIEQPPARRLETSSPSLPASSSATTTSSAPSSTSSASSGGSNTSSPTAQTSLPPPPPATQPSNNGNRTAVIAGSVIGGVALLAIGAIAFLFIRRKSKKRAGVELPAPPVEIYTEQHQYPNGYDKYYHTGAGTYVTELPTQSPRSELPGHAPVPMRP